MSDTMSCPNCSATLPSGAAFCTSCGTRTEAGSSAASSPPDDATRVDNPGLHDATQTYTPPAPAPWQPAETAAPAAPAAPAWEQPAAPAAPPWEQPSAPAAAPWAQQPAPAAPPSWQQPAPPQAPAWQQPAAPPGGGWNSPGAPGAQQWGAPAPAPTSGAGTNGSPLGGIAAVVGGVLTLVGLFTAWLGNNQDSITLSGWDLAGGDSPFESKDPYLLLALGIVALVVGVLLFMGTARTVLRGAAVVVGLVIIGTHVRDWMTIQDLVKDFPTGVEITAQFGFYLGIVGGVLTIIAALLPGKKQAA